MIGDALSPALLRWSADSQRLLAYINWDLGLALATAEMTTKTVSVVLLVSAWGRPVFQRSRLSISADGRLMAFVEETPVDPGEIFIAKLNGTGQTVGPGQLTRVHDDFALKDMVRVEKVSWKSRDGQFTIRGQLLTPASAWQGGKINGPLPAILGYVGGPFRVDADLGKHFGELFTMPAHGYAVLIPHTRGRNGWGYGERIVHGIRGDRSLYRLPDQDAMAGIDLLIAQVMIDPERMGVYRHSYGGGLASYTVTQTNRFRAAVSSDGGAMNLIDASQWLISRRGGRS